MQHYVWENLFLLLSATRAVGITFNQKR